MPFLSCRTEGGGETVLSRGWCMELQKAVLNSEAMQRNFMQVPEIKMWAFLDFSIIKKKNAELVYKNINI